MRVLTRHRLGLWQTHIVDYICEINGHQIGICLEPLCLNEDSLRPGSELYDVIASPEISPHIVQAIYTYF